MRKSKPTQPKADIELTKQGVFQKYYAWRCRTKKDRCTDPTARHRKKGGRYDNCPNPVQNDARRLSVRVFCNVEISCRKIETKSKINSQTLDMSGQKMGT